jgi:cysteine-rich repeat protein
MMARNVTPLRALFVAISCSALLYALQACQTAAVKPPACMLGSNVFCRCVDRSAGTKLCLDGQSFGVCRISKSRTCDEDPTYVPPPERDGGTTSKRDGAPTPAGDGGSPSGPVCGDDIVDDGEACDDGNLVNGDLCSAACLPIGDPPKGGVCPGIAVHLWDTETVTASATTTPYDNAHRSAFVCNDSSTGQFANDRVFAVTAHVAGVLVAEVSDSTFNQVLFARRTCSDDQSEFNCADAYYANTGEKLELPVEAGDTSYIFVDGTGNPSVGYGVIKFHMK